MLVELLFQNLKRNASRYKDILVPESRKRMICEQVSCGARHFQALCGRSNEDSGLERCRLHCSDPRSGRPKPRSSGGSFRCPSRPTIIMLILAFVRVSASRLDIPNVSELRSLATSTDSEHMTRRQLITQTFGGLAALT